MTFSKNSKNLKIFLLKIKKNDIFKKFKKFENFSVFSLGTPSGTVPSAVLTLIHLSLVLVINSHSPLSNRVKTFLVPSRNPSYFIKTTYFAFIC